MLPIDVSRFQSSVSEHMELGLHVAVAQLGYTYVDTSKRLFHSYVLCTQIPLQTIRQIYTENGTDNWCSNVFPAVSVILHEPWTRFEDTQ